MVNYDYSRIITGDKGMEIINNTAKTLRDDLAVEIKPGSKLSIAAACFSIYAFDALKEELKNSTTVSNLLVKILYSKA